MHQEWSTAARCGSSVRGNLCCVVAAHIFDHGGTLLPRQGPACWAWIPGKLGPVKRPRVENDIDMIFRDIQSVFVLFQELGENHSIYLFIIIFHMKLAMIQYPWVHRYPGYPLLTHSDTPLDFLGLGMCVCVRVFLYHQHVFLWPVNHVTELMSTCGCHHQHWAGINTEIYRIHHQVKHMMVDIGKQIPFGNLT